MSVSIRHMKRGSPCALASQAAPQQGLGGAAPQSMKVDLDWSGFLHESRGFHVCLALTLAFAGVHTNITL